VPAVAFVYHNIARISFISAVLALNLINSKIIDSHFRKYLSKSMGVEVINNCRCKAKQLDSFSPFLISLNPVLIWCKAFSVLFGSADLKAQ